jgi:hypothetical protein
MRKRIVNLLLAGFFYFLILSITQLNGNTGSVAPRPDWEKYKAKLDPKEPWRAVALKAELGPKLDKRIYRIFNAAFHSHRAGRYKKAEKLYKKLRSIPLDDNSKLDLYHCSEVFRHNWSLLKIRMKSDLLS